jgi:hypothetical protein
MAYSDIKISDIFRLQLTTDSTVSKKPQLQNKDITITIFRSNSFFLHYLSSYQPVII